MSDSTAPASTTTIMPAQNTDALDDVMSAMTGHASFMGALLDGATTIIQTAREDREQGRDVGVALNHARMLLEQIEWTYPSLNNLAEGVTALYERRSKRWKSSYGRMSMSHHIHPEIQDRIDQLRTKLKQVREMDAGVPDGHSPEAYRHLILNHDVSSIDVLGLADEETAPPSLAAAKILHMHYSMMCSIKNGRTFYRGDKSAVQTIVEWINWTGWALHNMAEITMGKHDRWHPEFFASECRCFVQWAQTRPVPADWHPDSSQSNDHPGPSWKTLCDFIARQAGMEPAYGVPVGPWHFHVDMPPRPEPPKPLMGLHTTESLKKYWYDLDIWCHDWARAQRAAMSAWPPSDPSTDDAESSV